MDIELCGFSLESLSDGERVLIDRARKALAGIEKSVSKEKNRDQIIAKNYLHKHEVMGAILFPDPLRLDFRAHIPGKIGQAFLGPQVPLTVDLFNGEKFKDGFVDEIHESWKEYVEYLLED